MPGHIRLVVEDAVPGGVPVASPGLSARLTPKGAPPHVHTSSTSRAE